MSRCAIVLLSLSMCACSLAPIRNSPLYAEAGAIIIAVEAIDIVAGCPLQLTQKFGDKLPEEAKCDK